MRAEQNEDRKMIMLWLAVVVVVFLLTSCATPAQQQDLFSSSQSNNATAAAAIQLAQYQEQALTATAQAPIVNITSTAAAFEMQQVYAQATSVAAVQTQVAALTTTAQWWTPTPNATSTAVYAAQHAELTQTALALERARSTNNLYALAPYFVGFLVTVLVVIFGVGLAKKMTHIFAEMDDHGRIKPYIDVVNGTVVDIEKMANYRGSTHDTLEGLLMELIRSKLDLPAQLPAITADRQDVVTARSQWVDMATRARLPKRLLESLEAQGQGLLPAPLPSMERDFLLPSWEIINSWDGKHGIPYYTAKGLETIDIERFPHISVLGATTTGKSRRFLRPLITCALAAGHRVVIVGKMADYDAFKGHLNATLLNVSKITEAGQAKRYAKILEGIVGEMNRRDDVLTSLHRSTWTHAGRNRTFIVLDEVGNVLRLMDKGTSDQCRIWIEGLVSESRKYGFNIVVANQRATSLRSILSQTGNAIFRVDADEEKAHRALAGASILSEGYFLAKFGVPRLAGAFEPTDEQIKAFLASHPVDKVDADDSWIEAVVSDAPAKLPQKNEASSQESKELSTTEDDKSELVRHLHAEGVSNTQIVYQVWGKAGSEFSQRMEQVKQILATAATATASNAPDLSLEGAAGQ